jgi:glycosyltransferase involved in cell wall biosynthesis
VSRRIGIPAGKLFRLGRTTFTIAIPTHDRRETVVLSALSALRQSRSPEQVVVLCDGCTDGTAEAVRALGDERVVVVELPKAPGYAYAHRNRALELARSAVILWLADDDLLLPDHLERIGEYWDAGVADIVTTPAAIVHPDDRLEWIGRDWSIPSIRELMLRENTNVMASVSVRAEVVVAVGGWDGDQARAGDWDLWKRVLASGARAAMTSEPTVLHFRATGRDQAWAARVRQNTAWLDEISDEARLPGLRRRLRRLGAERDASQIERIRELERWCVEFEERRNLLEHNLAEANARQAELAERAHELEGRARHLQAELDHVYAGGWWRLRRRLLPLMRFFGRGE